MIALIPYINLLNIFLDNKMSAFEGDGAFKQTLVKHMLFGFPMSACLTLKAPRKTASENVVCLCRLLNILADFSNLFLHTGKQCGP